MDGPTVLVTGGAGFIGSHVAERFAREGWAIRVLDDLSTGRRENLEAAWELQEGDVCDRRAVERAVAGAAVVVHLAAFTSVVESFERHRECYRSNVWGTWLVLEAARRLGARKLVFASSSALYAELPDAPKGEAERPEPTSPYAISKLEGEHLMEMFMQHGALASASLRFFNVYGPRQSAESDYAAAVPIFLERGLRGETLTIYGDGEQTRDFVYVADVAEAVFRAAGAPSCTGVYNVGTGQSLSVRALADMAAALTGGPREHRYEPSRPGDVRSSTADVERIGRVLGWRPATALDEGLAQTLAWMRLRL